MRVGLVLVVLLWAQWCAALGVTDSVHVDASLIHYSSDFERQQFADYNKSGKFEAINFLFCLDTSVNQAKAEQLKARLNQFFDDKLAPIVAGRNKDKALKLFFNEIHDNLLRKYINNARFEFLLDAGEYNCLTASALYAMAFQRFNMPYQLRSTTDHVYVIVNPGPGETIIETTDPQNGVYQYSDQYKKAYIERQVKTKMISKDEYNANNVDFLFKKYFYTSDTIDLKQLAGYHYYNNAVDLLGKENYTEASNQLMKAYLLNRSAKVEYLLIIALSAQLEKSLDIADTLAMKKYFLLEKLAGERDYNFLFNKYVDISEELALRQDDLPQYDRLSTFIFNHVDDSAQLSKFKEHYYLVKGSNYYDKHDFPGAYENMLLAYSLNNRDVRIKSAYKQVVDLLRQYGTDKEVIDSVYDIVIRNSKAVPAPIANDIMTDIWFLKAAYEFNQGNIERGDACLEKAEKIVLTDKDINLDHLVIDRAYGAVYTYYYLRNKMNTAMVYVQRGLKIDPTNITLKGYQQTLIRWQGINTPDPVAKPSKPASGSPPPRTVIVRTNTP